MGSNNARPLKIHVKRAASSAKFDIQRNHHFLISGCLWMIRGDRIIPTIDLSVIVWKGALD